jgi:hypothetical protein
MRWPKRIIEWFLLDVVVPVLCVCFLFLVVVIILDSLVKLTFFR